MPCFIAEPEDLERRGVGRRGVANTLVKSMDMGVDGTCSFGLGVEVTADGFFDAKGDMQIIPFLSSRSEGLCWESKKNAGWDDELARFAAVDGV